MQGGGGEAQDSSGRNVTSSSAHGECEAGAGELDGEGEHTSIWGLERPGVGGRDKQRPPVWLCSGGTPAWPTDEGGGDMSGGVDRVRGYGLKRDADTGGL